MITCSTAHVGVMPRFLSALFCVQIFELALWSAFVQVQVSGSSTAALNSQRRKIPHTTSSHGLCMHITALINRAFCMCGQLYVLIKGAGWL